MEIPREPTPVYNLFFQIERAKILELPLVMDERKRNRPGEKRKHRRTHGKISFMELSKSVSSKWGNLTEGEKQFYKDVYRRNDAAYKIELAQYQLWMKEENSDAPFSVDNTTQANGTASRQNNQHMPKKEDVTTPVHSRKVDHDGATRRYLPVMLKHSILSDRRNVAEPYKLELTPYPRWMKESHSDAPFSAVSTTQANGTASRQNNQLVPKKQDGTTQAPSRKVNYDGETRRYLPVNFKNSILPDRRNVAAPYKLELTQYQHWVKESHSDVPFSAVNTTQVNGTASRQNNQLVPKKQDVTAQAPSRKNDYDGGTRRYLPVKLKNSILQGDKMQNEKYYYTQPIALSEMLSHTIEDVEQELLVYASFLEKGLERKVMVKATPSRVKVDKVLTKLNQTKGSL
jgi:hypothetical protein